jgi:hypothetical protein
MRKVLLALGPSLRAPGINATVPLTPKGGLHFKIRELS